MRAQCKVQVNHEWDPNSQNRPFLQGTYLGSLKPKAITTLVEVLFDVSRL
jgi:hypothetical protein